MKSSFQYVSKNKRKAPQETTPTAKQIEQLPAEGINGITLQRIDVSHLFPRKRDAFAVVLDNVFTEAECNEMIRMTEEIGYEEALVGGAQVRVETQRNNWRCILDDKTLAEKIYQKLKDYIPPEWLGSKAVGLNERLRFLKYKPGEYFKPHNDGVYVRPDKSACTYVTIHIYLCDVEPGGGGETTFTTERMTYGRHTNRAALDDQSQVKRLSVRPMTGRVLIFEHHLPHEGSTLLTGVKYTVRTDVIYELDGKHPYMGPRWSTGVRHPQYKLPNIY